MEPGVLILEEIRVTEDSFKVTILYYFLVQSAYTNAQGERSLRLSRTERFLAVTEILRLLLNISRFLKWRRSQWPRGLMREPSSLARTLGSWVRIPLEV
jgi:hypothetical protein